MEFSKRLSDGRTATVVRKQGTWHVTVNGRPYTTGTLRELPTPKGPATHVIGARRQIGFTPQQAAQLQQILDAETAAYRASPRGRRAALITEVELATSAWRQAREHAADTGHWGGVKAAEQAMEAAQQALEAFDAAHPQLRAADQAARRAREQENIDAAFRN